MSRISLASLPLVLVAATLALVTAASATGRPDPLSEASVVVHTDRPGPRISPAVFGSTFLAPFGGMGAYDDAIGGFSPAFLNSLDHVFVGSMRFPGGITAQSYDWERAIGPQGSRIENPVAPANRPSPSTVGPDEFGQLLDRTGAAGVMTVNFATGTPAEAAALVQYMTGAPGSSAWADRRVADGHRAAYRVPWWEVGNEAQVSPYWALDPPLHIGGPAGCAPAKTCLYVYGGTTRIADQRLVTAIDRQPSAGVSTGQPDAAYQVAYPPVVPGSLAIRVAGVPWTQVASLATAAPDAPVYTLDPGTGTVQFGDGTHGAIPPAGAPLVTDYDSGPHAGLLRFYAAMKRANPAIHVCAGQTGPSFITVMGKHPYDCLQDHPYIEPTTLSSTEPIGTYERRVMGEPFLESAAVQILESEARQVTGRHVPLVLTEYGQLVSSTPDPGRAPYYLSSLDEALLNASQLAEWIRLGIPVADRQLLDAELPPADETTHSLRHIAPASAGGAIVTDGARSVIEPTGQMFEMMRPLAADRRLGISVAADPQLTLAQHHPIGDLSVLAGGGHGYVDVYAINRSPDSAVPVALSLAGFPGSGRVTLTTLDGPSALSINTLQAPHRVNVRVTHGRVDDGQLTTTLPAHSITGISLAGL